MSRKTIRLGLARMIKALPARSGAWLLCLCPLFGLGLPGCGSQPRVVLYCAQDQEFAEDVLKTFTDRTELKVATKFDTEAGKSVVHYTEIVLEKDRPRCDVFWNNEVLSTIRLQKQGLLAPYNSPAAEAYPSSCRADDHAWHAFAARARVLLVNTDLVQEAERPRSLLDLADKRWEGRVAMAKPNHGTTATQAACLFEVLGTERAKQYYRDLRANKVQIAPGNKQVAEWVGQGKAAVGVTDTDDAIAEVKAGRPVVIVFPDRDGRKDEPKMGTLFIPNTVAIVKGCPNPDGARKLVDYLLSEEVEAKLAEANSHQVPLNPKVKAKLPPQIETPATVKAMTVDFVRAAELWEEVQTFLAKEFATP